MSHAQLLNYNCVSKKYSLKFKVLSRHHVFLPCNHGRRAPPNFSTLVGGFRSSASFPVSWVTLSQGWTSPSASHTQQGVECQPFPIGTFIKFPPPTHLWVAKEFLVNTVDNLGPKVFTPTLSGREHQNGHVVGRWRRMASSRTGGLYLFRYFQIHDESGW